MNNKELTRLPALELHEALVSHRKWLKDPNYGKQIVFKNLDLSECDFCSFNLRCCVFENCLFVRNIFSECNFSDSVFRNCTFRKCTIQYCFMESCDFSGCDFGGSALLSSTFNRSVFKLGIFNECRLCGSNFRGADLSECRLDGCFISGCNIEGCGFPIMDSTAKADADDEIVRRIVDIGIQMGLNSNNTSDAMKDFLNSVVNLDNK